MPDNDNGDNKPNTPTQIPLLEDVVSDAKKPDRVRRRPTKTNLDLNLNPAPPMTTDLFADLIPPSSSGHGKASDANTVADAAAEAAFREQAHQLVDRFVQEYSEEILRRLRSELTTLLDDLKSEDPPHP